MLGKLFGRQSLNRTRMWWKWKQPKRGFSQSPGTEKIEIFINNKPVLVDPRMTIFQACQQENITVPRFCYHEKLAIAGNCRMCLVEIEKYSSVECVVLFRGFVGKLTRWLGDQVANVSGGKWIK